MNKCLIVGGGFAGLTAATYLAHKNISVELIEASPRLGGRAYSFLDRQNYTILDNGQHIMMGCYRETMQFLKMISANDKLTFQKNLNITFLRSGFEQIPLKASRFCYPFNLLFALLNYKALSFSERFKAIGLVMKLRTVDEKLLSSLTIREWLRKENQTENTIRTLWEIIAIGSLNSSIHRASAKVFVDVLREMFLTGNFASTIIYPKYGLSETYCEPAKSYIEKHSGTISNSEIVKEFVIEDDKIVEVVTNKRRIKDFKVVISAVPNYSVEKLLSADQINFNNNLVSSSILSIHIWLKKNNLKKDFYGLIDSHIHWVFNKRTHLTLVVSDADYLINKSKKTLFELVTKELERFFGIKKNDIVDYRIIKERRATFIPSNKTMNNRPGARTNIQNLILAGDWTDTGLPATIEGAVKSGRIAAEEVCKILACFYNPHRKRKS